VAPTNPFVDDAIMAARAGAVIQIPGCGHSGFAAAKSVSLPASIRLRL